jgi:hypothetical protein
MRPAREIYQRSWVVHLIGSDSLPENLAHESFIGSVGLFLALHSADTGWKSAPFDLISSALCCQASSALTPERCKLLARTS